MVRTKKMEGVYSEVDKGGEVGGNNSVITHTVATSSTLQDIPNTCSNLVRLFTKKT